MGVCHDAGRGERGQPACAPHTPSRTCSSQRQRGVGAWRCRVKAVDGCDPAAVAAAEGLRDAETADVVVCAVRRRHRVRPGRPGGERVWSSSATLWPGASGRSTRSCACTTYEWDARLAWASYPCFATAGADVLPPWLHHTASSRGGAPSSPSTPAPSRFARHRIPHGHLARRACPASPAPSSTSGRRSRPDRLRAPGGRGRGLGAASARWGGRCASGPRSAGGPQGSRVPASRARGRSRGRRCWGGLGLSSSCAGKGDPAPRPRQGDSTRAVTRPPGSATPLIFIDPCWHVMRRRAIPPSSVPCREWDRPRILSPVLPPRRRRLAPSSDAPFPALIAPRSRGVPRIRRYSQDRHPSREVGWTVSTLAHPAFSGRFKIAPQGTCMAGLIVEGRPRPRHRPSTSALAMADLDGPYPTSRPDHMDPVPAILTELRCRPAARRAPPSGIKRGARR